MDKRLDMLELRNLQNNRILKKKLQTLSNSRMKNMHHMAMTSVHTYLHNCSLPSRNTCRVKVISMMTQQQKSMLRQSFLLFNWIESHIKLGFITTQQHFN